MTKQKPKKKRLVRGQDFDAWAVKMAGGTLRACSDKKIAVMISSLHKGSSVVRVKFVEVKP